MSASSVSRPTKLDTWAGRLCRSSGGRAAGTSWRRIDCSSRWSSSPGSRPRSSARRARARRYADSASVWRSARYRREHEVTPQAFAVRVVVDEPLQLVDQLGIPAEREVGLDPVLERGQAQVVQPLCLDQQGAVLADPRERRATPQVQGQAQPRRRGASRSALERLVALPREPLEPCRVDVMAIGIERVATDAAPDRGTVTERRAELRNVGAQRRRGAVGRLAVPELVGEPVDRHRLGSGDQQQGEQGVLARATERDRAPIPIDLDRPQHPELDHPGSGSGSGSGLAAIVMPRW